MANAVDSILSRFRGALELRREGLDL